MYIIISNVKSMDAAKDLLKRAVELDSAQRYPEALICYEEGIQNILRAMEGCQLEEERRELRKKAGEYLARAEDLKQRIKQNEGPAERVQCIQIKTGEVGFSYNRVFNTCLDGNVSMVEVLDPYIRAKHQIHNFVRFCELVVKSCQRLKTIHLTTSTGDSTSQGEASQQASLRELEVDLKEYGVTLVVDYSSTLHDREIRFSNGWIAKLGRGLDYFLKPKGQFTIGFNDFDLRPCHETTVEIFHRLNVKNVKR